MTAHVCAGNVSKALQEELRRRREGVDDFVAPRRTYICTRPLTLHEPEAAVDLFNGAILVALGIPTGGEDAGEEGEEEGEEEGAEGEEEGEEVGWPDQRRDDLGGPGGPPPPPMGHAIAV